MKDLPGRPERLRSRRRRHHRLFGGGQRLLGGDVGGGGGRSVRDAAVPLLAASSSVSAASADPLLLELPLEPQLLELVHLGDRLLEVLDELGAVVLVPGVEHEHHLPVPLLGNLRVLCRSCR